MLRLIGWLVITLWLILALLIGGSRWVGRQYEPAFFPLPGADGCWQKLCLFRPTSIEALVAALNNHPNVVPGSAIFIPDLQPGGYNLIALTYTPDGNRTKPVLLYWVGHSYSFARDWREVTNPQLARLGDVMAAIGVPTRVDMLYDYAILYYPDRRLRVTVRLTRQGIDWAQVEPENFVLDLQVISPDLPDDSDTSYYPSSSPWHGFGVYEYRP